MNLTVSIESAEHAFKQILEDFFVSIYDEKILYSHGLNHHRRVWQYAKELLCLHPNNNNDPPFCDPSRVIIACYLHDIGMSVEPGLRHGKYSREICMEFLEKHGLSPAEFAGVLETIENHDKKDYPQKQGSNELLAVLSAADDLDAFGFTGIFRYSEIYLMRGINPSVMGKQICENAGKRFKNFEAHFGSDTLYVQNQKKRYEILLGFFKNYDEQAGSYEFKSSLIEGYCGVIQLFKSMKDNNLSITELLDKGRLSENDIIIRSYFNGLHEELTSGT